MGLLYPDGESGLLTLCSDELPLKGDPVQDMVAVLNRYLAGPALSSQWLPFPQGCELRSLYELDPHTVVVDLTGPVSSGGGSTVEMARVYGVIDTLHWNFPHVSGVQILVDGRQVQTLLGHVDVSKPLPADPLMVEPGLRTKFAGLGS
ncbi:MAG: GerMN domain-containing protein [Acidobacteriota bacterium]